MTWPHLLRCNLYSQSFQSGMIMYIKILKIMFPSLIWITLPFNLYHFFPFSSGFICPKTLWFIELCSLLMSPLIPSHATLKLSFSKVQERGMAGTPFHLLWKVRKYFSIKCLFCFVRKPNQNGLLYVGNFLHSFVCIYCKHMFIFDMTDHNGSFRAITVTK